jgi:hypothetical protein
MPANRRAWGGSHRKAFLLFCVAGDLYLSVNITLSSGFGVQRACYLGGWVPYSRPSPRTVWLQASEASCDDIIPTRCISCIMCQPLSLGQYELPCLALTV